MKTLICELVAFAIYFIYGSYFEWFFHRYCFHTPKLFYRMFKAHTLVHHQIYKGDHTYTVEEGTHPEKVTMDWWAMPAMIGVHLPIFWLIQKVTGIPSLWGGVFAVGAYYAIYEYLHYVMHVPATLKKLNRYSWFRFIDNHHLIHHKYMLSNLNVILPIADLTLGTYRDANGNRVQLFKKSIKKTRPMKTEQNLNPGIPAHVVK